jgi:hypothetical protein
MIGFLSIIKALAYLRFFKFLHSLKFAYKSYMKNQLT